MDLEKYTKIRTEVYDYLNTHGKYYLPKEILENEVSLSHVVNCGTNIMAKKLGLAINIGSFARAVVNNDLLTAVTTADKDNTKALRFYVIMKYNLTINLK